MGTRADFYVGKGKQAEWIGSIAFDGYPGGSIDKAVLVAKTETKFRKAVASMLDKRDDATKPEQGWPWPWDDSRTTDYAYAFDGGKVSASCFGRAWFNPTKAHNVVGAKVAEFPDMTDKRKVTLGKRSGLIVLTSP